MASGSPADRLRAKSEQWSAPLNSADFAKRMDGEDELHHFRERFHFPKAPEGSGKEHVTYLCGNSLGLQPKQLREAVNNQLDKWADEGVEGHFTEPTPWVSIDDIVKESAATLVGAKPLEVAIMNTLSGNLHFMMVSFYRPTAERYKILIEKKAFPSDTYAVQSQVAFHGHAEDGLLEVGPREGETTLRTEDILAMIENHGHEVALVMLSGLQYYTGQFFDIGLITAAAKGKGCMVGWDLAHAVGNVPLSLHDWDVDFACWCSYKYLNSGPGSIAGCYVHERYSQTALPRFEGWWGHRLEDRFQMGPVFQPEEGAYAWRLSNPSVLLVTCMRASLDVFEEAGGMQKLRQKSLLLTGYLELLLKQELSEKVQIFTPEDPAQRGCQLSLSFSVDVDGVLKALNARGVMCDVRRPNVMRIAPTPLYNSFSDVFEFVHILKNALESPEMVALA